MRTDAPDFATTSLRLPRETLAVLRRAAVERAEQQGGRVSVSRVVSDLVETHRAELVQEKEPTR